MDRFRFLIIIVILATVGGLECARTAEADIYSFRDADGVVHLTNAPPDSRYQMIIRESPRQPSSISDAARRPGLTDRSGSYGKLVAKAAREHHLDQALLRAVIAAESNYNPRAVSSKGAVGLMQLMPETARRYGVTDLYDPAENIHAGAQYLRDLLRKFNDDLPLTLAAYNAGEDAVVRYGNRIPPYLETRLYVPRVLKLYRQYQPEVR